MFKIEMTHLENETESTANLTLPTDQKTLDNANTHGTQMFRISECEKFPELVNIEFDENPTLGELNFLAEKLEKVAESKWNTAAYRGLLRDGIHTINDALTCALNVKTVAVYECGNLEEYGRLAMRDLLFGEFNEVPRKEDGSVDYEKIGQIEHEENSGYFIDGCYVITSTYCAEITPDIAEEKNGISMGGIS